MTATINGTVVAYPSTLDSIKALYPRLADGESIVITDEQGTEIERHIRRDGKVVSEECGVDYDSEAE